MSFGRIVMPFNIHRAYWVNEDWLRKHTMKNKKNHIDIQCDKLVGLGIEENVLSACNI